MEGGVEGLKGGGKEWRRWRARWGRGRGVGGEGETATWL